MATTEEFEAAAQRAQQLPTKPSNLVLLQLYALYKQATEGNVTGDRPGGFDFKAIAKYDAWAGHQRQVAGRRPQGVRRPGKLPDHGLTRIFRGFHGFCGRFILPKKAPQNFSGGLFYFN